MRALGHFKELVLVAAIIMLCVGCGDKATSPQSGQYTVTFSANGGSGTPPSPQTVDADSAITLPGQGGLTRSGYDFGGWNTNNSGTGTNYAAGSSYTPDNSITLYAKWDVNDSTFTDNRDGTIYKKVTIGGQTWMAENLKYNTEGSKCHDREITCAKYGRYYDWEMAMSGEPSSSASPSGVQGICPAGWHLPSDAEWTELVDYAGGDESAGAKLKSSTDWPPGYSGTDDYGFAALPSGGAFSDGVFNGVGYGGVWWTTTEYDVEVSDVVDPVHVRRVIYNGDYVGSGYNGKYNSFSVRCVEN